jgi:hypothetical protein
MLQTHFIVTNESDKQHAYIFKANFPYQLLECLDDPTHSFDGHIGSLTIYYIKVSFKPYASFSGRILLHLVGSGYVSGLGIIIGADPHGQKRKLDRIEEPSQAPVA